MGWVRGEGCWNACDAARSLICMLIGGTCQEGKRKENSAGKPFSLYLISAVVSPRRFDKSSLISEARKEKKE